MSRGYLDKIIIELLINEPFYGAISKQIHKFPTKEPDKFPTAAISFNPSMGRFEMQYNEDFFRSLTKEQVLAVLKHEFLHAILGHVTTKSKMIENPILLNYAMDAEINSWLTNLPEGFVVGEDGEPKGHCIQPGKPPFEDLDPFKGTEYYCTYLLKKFPELKDLESFMQKYKITIMDDHDGFGKAPAEKMSGNDQEEDGEGNGQGETRPLTELEARVAEHMLREALRRSVSNIKRNNLAWGSIPQEGIAYIEKLISMRVDWRAVVREFIQKSKRAERVNTWRRVNRREPYIRAGAKRERMANILIGIDQSGSVSDSLLSIFFGELANLADFADFDVAYFDTEVDKDLLSWKKGDDHPPIRRRFGGTDFNPISRFADEKSYDGLIIMTDMGAPKPEKIKTQRMWICLEGDKKTAPFQTDEAVVTIDED